MSDPFYDNLLKRLDELREEVSRLEDMIAFYERKPNSRYRLNAASQTVLKAGKRPRGNPEKIADAAEQVLLSNGRPMTRGNIAKELKRMGVQLPPTDPAKYVGTILWRHQDRFEHREGEGYWVQGHRPARNSK